VYCIVVDQLAAEWVSPAVRQYKLSLDILLLEKGTMHIHTSIYKANSSLHAKLGLGAYSACLLAAKSLVKHCHFKQCLTKNSLANER
jgi:hypothetical protein